MCPRGEQVTRGRVWVLVMMNFYTTTSTCLLRPCASTGFVRACMGGNKSTVIIK